MQNNDENIDLDALFDMLNIEGAASNAKSGASDKANIAKSSSLDLGQQDVTALDADFFLFDLPSDQS